MSQNYTPEFKNKIVRLHEEEGRTYKSITAEYGVSKASISKWCSEFSKECQTNPQAEDAAAPIAQITLLEYGVTDKTANISAKFDPYAEGKYLLPYRKNAANIGFSGLNWNTSKYLYPISNKQFRLTTAVPGSNEYESSTIYQNPGWSRNDGTLPEGE